MVAMSIFMVLGSMLVVALRSGVDIWRITEDKRVMYEQAHLILKQIESDLVNVAVPQPGEEGDVRVRFLCDLDANRRYRLRFVRTLKGGMEDGVLRMSGTGPPDTYEDVLDSEGSRDKKLQPLGGLMEVCYVMDPDPASNIMYRGVRSPVGGEGSLFRDENLNTRKKIMERCYPVADGVLYLGFRFWTQYTTTWDLHVFLSDTLGSPCGPEVIWDSTRGVLPNPRDPGAKRNPNVFWLGAGEGSRHDPSDDVFPRQMQVELVATAGGGGPRATLVQDLDRKDRVVAVDSAGSFATEEDPDMFRYIRIGAEWIYYESRTKLKFETRSRGARGTKAAGHEAGEEVLGGRPFVLTVKIPSHRGHWYGDQRSKLRARHAPKDPAWLRRGERAKGK